MLKDKYTLLGGFVLSEKNTILESLRHVITNENKKNVLEMRSQHVISSVIYLIEAFESNYDEQTAEALKKKLIASIKAKKPERFSNFLKNKNNEK